MLFDNYSKHCLEFKELTARNKLLRKQKRLQKKKKKKRVRSKVVIVTVKKQAVRKIEKLEYENIQNYDAGSSNIIKYYGNVGILSAYCSECNQQSFIINKCFTCCGMDVMDNKFSIRYRVSTDKKKRRRLPDSLKKYILNEQENCCFYCLMPFNFEVERNGKIIKRKIEFDHIVPFSYLNNNDKENLVASCDVCNRLKSSMVFQTTDESRIYLQSERESKGYNF